MNQIENTSDSNAPSKSDPFEELRIKRIRDAALTGFKSPAEAYLEYRIKTGQIKTVEQLIDEQDGE